MNLTVKGFSLRLIIMTLPFPCLKPLLMLMAKPRACGAPDGAKVP